MLLPKLFCVTVIFVVFNGVVESQEGCNETDDTPTCEYGFVTHKFCGKWACYGAYSNIHPDWRGYWGVTHVCEWTWPGSFALSIHCKEENDFAQATYGAYYMGLHIPENLPWAVNNFRWTDGTPVDFTDWAQPGQGSPVQQPHNDVPGQTERVVAHTNHWHDIVGDQNIQFMACKKTPIKKECRKAAAAAAPPPPPPPTTCTEKVICEFGFVPHKLCGKWACYGAYSNILQDWRGYWGVTHVCEWTWPGSFALSIHCKEENDFAQATYGAYFMGLHIPENLPWAVKNFRWTDGTPVDFTDWALPGQGSPVQQPHNDVPGYTERVVAHTNHWHDIVWDPNIQMMACKKTPVRIEVCPTTPAPPAAPEMEPIKMEDIPLEMPVTIRIPSNDSKTSNPPKVRSCRI